MLRTVLRVVLAFALFSVLFAAFCALLFGTFYGFLNGNFWLGLVCAVAVIAWTWITLHCRNPENPEDFKDFGV